MPRFINLEPRDFKKAEDFLEIRKKSSGFYQERASFKEEDIKIGALGEIAAARFLNKHGFKTSPDFTEHTIKSFDADLVFKDKHFHVKSQSKKSADRYGDSWIFQKTDPLVVKPQYRHYVVLVSVDLEKKRAEIKAVVAATTLKEFNIYGECKSEYHRLNKIALYMDKVRTLSRKALWGIIWKKKTTESTETPSA